MFKNPSSMVQFLRTPRVDNLFSRGRQQEPRGMEMSHIPQQETFGAPEAEPDNRPPGQRFIEEILKLRTTKGKATSAYEDHLSNLPDSEKHKPGWFTRIAAGLSGMGAGVRNPGEGIAVARDVNRASYDRAMEDYYNKAKTLGAGAELERKSTDDYVDALGKAGEYGLSWEQHLANVEKNRRAADAADDNVETNRMRAEAYIESIRNPGYEYMPQVDGSVLSIHRRTGERKIIPANDVRSYSARTNASIGFGNLNARNRAIDQAGDHFDQRLEFDRQAHEDDKYDTHKGRELRQREMDLRERLSRGNFVSPRDLWTARALAIELAATDGLEGIDENEGVYTLKPDAPADTKAAIEAKVSEIVGRRR